jgi:hypothetical protein
MHKSWVRAFAIPACLLLISSLACSVNFSLTNPAPPDVPTDTQMPSLTNTLPTSTSTATFTPTSTNTFTPTLTPTMGLINILPLDPLLIFLVASDTPSQQLDYTLPPTYGEVNLGAGFTPDPYQVSVNAGGNVNVSYLGSSCSGFTGEAPDVRLNFSGGGASLIRLYYIAGQDSTLVINDPYGNFYCVDDSFGTVNPTIDFNNPAGGTYDIWVASYSAGNMFNGMLSFTANASNHP